MDIEKVEPQNIQDFLDEQVPQEERPDKTLLRQFVELVERQIGDFDFKDVRCEPGVVDVDGTAIEMETIGVGLAIADKDRKDGRIEWLFSNWFEPAALALVSVIAADGYNVCRPLGIRNPNLTADTGALQLTHQGEKLDVYMSHLYHEKGESGPYTEVKLELLVGKL